MRYDRVIWDFNGTILDDAAIGVEIFNAMLARRGLPLVGGLDRYREVFGFPVLNTYSQLGFELEKEDFNEVAVEFHREYDRLFPKAGLTEGITGVLEALNRAAVPQHVLSATEQTRLDACLETLGISRFFESAHGVTNLLAESKTALAARCFSRYSGEKAVFIGDTAHDAEAAAAAGADCILVSWGHQSVCALEETGAAVVESVSRLIAALNG